MNAIFDETLTPNIDQQRKSEEYKALQFYHIFDKLVLLAVLLLTTPQYWMLGFLSTVLPNQSSSVVSITKMPKCEIEVIKFEIHGTKSMCVFGE